MKIKPEHYNHIKRSIDALTQVEILNIQDNALTNLRAKDVNKFYRWQLFYYARLSTYACDVLYNYLDDSHIDSALRSIINELKINLPCPFNQAA